MSEKERISKILRAIENAKKFHVYIELDGGTNTSGKRNVDKLLAKAILDDAENYQMLIEILTIFI